jgi:hypothetical protein
MQDARGLVWKREPRPQTKVQLDQYLSAVHSTRYVNLMSVYGIVAVGMYMRVYQYDDAINSVGSIVDLGVPYTGESEMP